MGNNHRGKFQKSKRGFQQKKGHNNHRNSNGPRHVFKRPADISTAPKERSLNETEIGVTQYVSDTKGFTGVIKSRFSDFQVNEIDLNGDVVHLTNQAVPTAPPVSKDDVSENSDELNKILSKEKWEEIKGLEKASKNAFVEIDVTEMDKGVRKSIHMIIREMFGGKLLSSTLDKDDKKFIKLTKIEGKGRVDWRVQWTWPHEYVHFVMYKENIDTMAAASQIAPGLNTAASHITYAGTKDKRAKTAQMFCIKKRQPALIAKAASKILNIRVGNFAFKPEPLKLGQLNGNRFRIALRRVSGSEEDIVQSLEQVKVNGFINYYGLQRFGSCSSVPTYEIGIALIKGQFKEAVELIMKPRPNDPDFLREIREHWMVTRDADSALKMFHRRTGIEARLLTGLSKHGRNDYINALAAIPRNMRLLYIHSYQSLIWNEIASRRIKELGMDVRVGDLVFVDPSNHASKEGDLIEGDLDSLMRQPTKGRGGNEEDEAPKTEEDATDEMDEEDEEPVETISFKDKVRPLTDVDIKSGAFTIHDIVLPLPGHDITYPSNEVGQWYVERLLKDDLSSEKLLQKQKAYSLSGAYRKMLVKPEKMSWQFMKYNSDTETLILSDLEILQKKPTPSSIENGQWTGLVIDFCLPSSTYATMALREILKADTSSSVQFEISMAQGKEKEQVEKDDDVSGTPAKKAKLPQVNVETMLF